MAHLMAHIHFLEFQTAFNRIIRSTKIYYP